MELIQAFLHGMVGGVVVLAYLNLKDKIKHPYRFKCPEEECFYKISGNEKSLIDDLRTEHRREHLRQKEKAR